MNNLIQTVEELNEKLYEKSPKSLEEYGVCYSYMTNGLVEMVEFMGVIIFNSENQEWDEDKEDYYEPNVEYLTSRTRDMLTEILKGIY